MKEEYSLVQVNIWSKSKYSNTTMLAGSVISIMSNSLPPCGLWPVRLLCPWNSPGRNTVGIGLSCPAPRTLPDPGIEPTSLVSPVLAGVHKHHLGSPIVY